MSYGFDYGLRQSNIDPETGIRYGVINQNAVLQAWADSSEGDYGPPTCEECGNEVVAIDNESVPDLDGLPTIRRDGMFTRKRPIRQLPGDLEWRDEGRDFACLHCKRSFSSDDAYGDEPLAFTLDDGEYKAQSDDYGDIFIVKSPYFTYAEFCSPCAPGSCYLENSVDEEGPRAYCFAPDWFDCWSEEEETGKYEGQATSCPYPVYRVDTGECIFRPTREGDNNQVMALGDGRRATGDGRRATGD